MFYYLVRYSFDATKPVFGPFKTESEAWEAALVDARKEFKIDEEENEWNCDMSEYEDFGEIVLTNHFTDRDDTTEWLVFEMEV